ncbi:MAG: NUDIX hydrolase [Thermoleophilaceae bacterium]|nr:NUDIX hydrolase [Thermoleophilaceae bacterium]
MLARGPWAPTDIEARWSETPWHAPADLDREADARIAALRERGSPTHDGLSGRLARYEETDAGLVLDCEPARWAIRLIEGRASDSLTSLCVVRTRDGRWLAGRRAAWVSTWAGRWALGAGGAVDVGESPAHTLSRELEEEWALIPEALRVEALIRLPTGLTMMVGMATVADDSEPTMDAEHDAWAWWPADVDTWPAEADERVQSMARFLS